MIKPSEYNMVEVRFQLDKARKQLTDAQKKFEFDKVVELTQKCERLEYILTCQDIHVENVMEGLSNDDAERMKQKSIFLLAVCDMVEGAALDFMNEVKKNVNIQHMQIVEDAATIRRVSGKVRKIVIKDDEESFGEMVDQCIPLIMNKVKKWCKSHLSINNN